MSPENRTGAAEGRRVVRVTGPASLPLSRSRAVRMKALPYGIRVGLLSWEREAMLDAVRRLAQVPAEEGDRLIGAVADADGPAVDPELPNPVGLVG